MVSELKIALSLELYKAQLNAKSNIETMKQAINSKDLIIYRRNVVLAYENHTLE